MKIYSRLAVVFLSTVGLFAPAHALVLAGGRGNTTAPTNTDWCHIGWSNVGSVRSPINSSRAGVVYLCDNWFITTYHAWYYDRPTGVVVGVTGYTVDTNSMIRLTNNTALYTNMQPDADIALFRVTQKPNLLPLNITTMPPGDLWLPVNLGGNKTIFMIGSGHPREDAPTYWNAGWTNTTPSNAVYSGYKFWPDRTQCVLRWGSNQIDTTRFKLTMPVPFGDVWAFTTIFNTNAGPDECQIAPLDSGGGVFYNNNGYWELAGLMSTMSQPDGTDPKLVWGIANGGVSLIADLSYYRDQVMKIIKTNGWPDLVIDPAPSTNSASPEASVSITITTRNQGAAAIATNFNTVLYLVPSWNAPYTTVTQATFIGMDAGESVTNEYTFTAPATLGVYYLIARADDGTNANGNVNESYENNNQSGWTARVLKVGPDLTASSSTNNVRIAAHLSGKINFVIRNNGSDATGFETVLFLSPTNTVASMTNAVATNQFSNLPAGQSVTTNFTFKAPRAPGTYYLCAQADKSLSVTELNETNNWSGMVTLEVFPMAMPWLNLLLE